MPKGLYVKNCQSNPRHRILLLCTVQSHWLTLFGHIMCMDNNADAKRILLVPPSADWRRQPGRPCITRLSTTQKDLKQHHLTLPKAADLAQNRPLWRTMSTYGAAQSWELHARNDDSTCQSCSPKCQALALMPPRDLWPWPQRSMPWP